MHYIYLTVAIFFLVVTDAHAYVGPGLGLGAIGAIFGVIFSIFLAIVGFIWYPIRRIIRKRKMKNDKSEQSENNINI